MPFKSKAQQRWMFAAEERGEVPAGTAARWAHHTKNIKKLPEKKEETTKAAFCLDRMLIKAARAQLVKQALDVESGGWGSRGLAATAGRLNPFSLFNLIATGRAYHSSALADRRKKYETLAHDMSSAAPEQLHDVVLGLEGANLSDDLLWKKQRNNEHLPWYKRVGGRLWHNPHTTLLNKAVSTLEYPFLSPLMSLLRGSYFNPATDRAVIYGDEPAVASHELGHAIDFNDPTFKWKNPERLRYLKSLANRTTRDAYHRFVAMASPLNLLSEAQANIKSRQAIEKGMPEGDEKDELWARRQEVLPAGYGAYIGGALAPFLGLQMPLAGAIGGKVYGLHAGGQLREEQAKKKKETTKKGSFAGILGQMAAQLSC